MPEIYLKNKKITRLVTSIVWSGDYQQAARKLELNIAVSSLDINLPVINISLGDMVKMFDDDGSELFRGYVFSKEKSSTSNEMSVTVYDGLIYLLKSKGTYNFKKLTPEQITAKVAGDFGIPVKNLAATGIPVSFIADAVTIYDIILQAYTEAARQNGKAYLPIMEAGCLNVIEKGSRAVNYDLSDVTNITGSSYSETLENMINRVRIYDDKGNQAGIVENGSWIKSFGILQDVYTKEQGKNAYTVANGMLHGVDRTGNISAIGNTACITGMAVLIKDTPSGMTGLFYIDTDEHSWQDGQYSMSLNINLQDIMDDKKAKKLIKKAKKSKKSSAKLLDILEAGGYKQ